MNKQYTLQTLIIEIKLLLVNVRDRMYSEGWGLGLFMGFLMFFHIAFNIMPDNKKNEKVK